MRARRIVVVSALMAFVVAILPVAASLYLSWILALADERQELETLAREIITRSERVRRLTRDSLVELAAYAGMPCSDEHIALLRTRAFADPYMREFGAFIGDRLACTSWGRIDQTILAGTPDWTSPDGFMFWYSVDTKVAASGSRSLVVKYRDHNAVVDPRHLSDVVPAQPDTGFVVFTEPRRIVLAASGAAAPPRLVADYHGEETADDGTWLAAFAPAETMSITAAAFVPRARAIAHLYREAVVIVPLGIASGGVLVALVVRLASRRLSMRAELQIALRRREFVVHYQPIVGLADGRCLGAEALLRWRRADGSLMRPDLFIPAAEETGLIRPITAQIIETVAADMEAVLAARPDMWISINVAAADLVDADALSLFEAALQRASLNRAQISFEATESARLDAQAAQRAIARLRDAGHKLMIDDFGTGYSNLSYLQTLGVDGLKIDKSFVDAIGEGAATSAVITHIIAMAAALDLKIVAEGVETEAQAAFLRAHGIDYAQGWLYAKAMPATEFREFASRQTQASPGPSGA